MDKPAGLSGRECEENERRRIRGEPETIHVGRLDGRDEVVGAIDVHRSETPRIHEHHAGRVVEAEQRNGDR